MRHNIIQCLFPVLVLLGGAIAHAQDSASGVLENAELATARAQLQAGRVEIIRMELQLTDGETNGFWRVYHEYQAQIRVVRDRQAKMMADLLQASRAGKLSEDFADRVIDDHFEIAGDLLKIQRKFVRQFKKVLPSAKVARFYQLENKMDAEINAQLALFMPLVEAT